MGNEVTVTVNGVLVSVSEGASVAAAILQAGAACRISVTGEPRGALCGMGTCFECRAEINGVAHVRSCRTLCEPGMDVKTDE
jgi:predicted molibdopterin-dependent oxidoreductase YjgC